MSAAGRGAVPGHAAPGRPASQPVVAERLRFRACLPCETEEQVLVAVERGWEALARLALRHLERLGVRVGEPTRLAVTWESGTLALVPVPPDTRLRVRRCLAAVQRASARICAVCGRVPATVCEDTSEWNSDWRDRPLCAVHRGQVPYTRGHARLWAAHRAVAIDGPAAVRALVAGARVTPAGYRAAVRGFGRMLIRRPRHNGEADWIGLALWALEDGAPGPAHRAALRPADLVPWLTDRNESVRACAVAASALVAAGAPRRAEAP